VRELFVTAEAARRNADVLRVAAADEVQVTLVTERVLATLADTVTPQGVVAVVGTSGDRALPSGLRLAVVLADVADPGNAGTVIRTADAAAVDPHNPKCVRATAGSLFHLPVQRHDDVFGALAACRAAGAVVLATTVDADGDLYDVLADVRDQPVVWVFGNEARGLDPGVAEAADRRVRIPMYGRAESLNLAAAAAVCLYATAREQRRTP
jgi:TrmH family RNA methyltransferase